MPTHDDVQVSGEHALEDLDAAAMAYAASLASATPPERTVLRDQLTRFCLPFAGRMAGRYRGRGEPLEDLEQVARLGLIKAIDRYDPERGSFTAYAVSTISGEIKRHFRDKTWGVHVPRRIQDLSLEVGHASVVLTNALSRRPTIAELAARLEVTEPAILQAIESSVGYTPASLNAPVSAGDGTAEVGDLLGSTDGELELIDDKMTVERLLLRLPVRERQMLAMRFYGNRTQAEIAAELGISQMHVSRLLSRALAWLREAMLSDVVPRWEGAARPDDPDMHVSVTRTGGVLIVAIRGEIDRDTADRLRIGLRHAVSTARGDRLVIDLSGVPLVDAAGVAVLLDAASATSVADVPLSLRHAQPYVSRILAVSGLAALLDDRR